MKKNKESKWLTLDNAGKLFAATSNKYDTKVFRLACELTETVDPVMLQEALTETMTLFPLYRSTLKRGIFWYYLEQSDLEPVVKEETKPPCSVLYNKDQVTLLFEVTYYHHRINLEVFHALTDGTGALDFFKTLVQQYLIKRHKDAFSSVPMLSYDASSSEKLDDSFNKYYDRKRKNKGHKSVKSYQIRGSKYPEKRIQVVEGQLSVQAVLALAHKYQTTVTVFLVANFILAIRTTMIERSLKHPIVVAIPVNLRNYFSSKSARNFFGLVQIGYDFTKQSGTFEEIIQSVDQYLKQELTQENIEGRMNRMSALEHTPFARIIPLPLKNFGMKLAIELTENDCTASISNLNKIDMPKEFAPYIRLFDAFIWTNKMQACVCSYEDVMVISFASPFVSKDIQKNFFRTFTNMGAEVNIVTTPMEEL